MVAKKKKKKKRKKVSQRPFNEILLWMKEQFDTEKLPKLTMLSGKELMNTPSYEFIAEDLVAAGYALRFSEDKETRARVADMLAHLHYRMQSKYPHKQWKKANGSRVIKQFNSWAVTTYGLESLTWEYSIEKSRISGSGCCAHMAEKNWVNVFDFEQALKFARVLWSLPEPKYGDWRYSNKFYEKQKSTKLKG